MSEIKKTKITSNKSCYANSGRIYNPITGTYYIVKNNKIIGLDKAKN